jgi:uncharacterized protein
LTPSQDLEHLKREALDKEEENGHFKDYLRAQDPLRIDTMVHRLNDEISPRIDCTACGNCCKSLMINVSPEEVTHLADRLGQSEDEIRTRYIETSLMGTMVLDSVPCPFLSGTVCSIYEDRFHECREFPSLHQDGFIGRLFPTFMHYGRCPIIYNVVERLKTESGFL